MQDQCLLVAYFVLIVLEVCLWITAKTDIKQNHCFFSISMKVY